MNRIDRISAILIQLQSRRIVKAQDIADRFAISLRTVYRDIRTLEEAGVPILGEAGVGYTIMDGYRLPPVMFTREEAIALLTAEKLVAKMTDTATTTDHQSAMFKIKSVLRSTEKDILDHIDNRIEIVQGRRPRPELMTINPLQTILQAIAERKVLHLSYLAYQQQETTRCVEPIGVFYLDHYWHLIAFCRLRQDYRDFRMDRMSAIQLGNERFQPVHPPLQEYLRNLYPDRNLDRVVLRINKTIVRHLAEQKYYNGLVSEEEHDEYVDMTFLTYSSEGLVRWYLSFGDEAQILEPSSLRERAQEIIRGMAQYF
ncbi:helix-turn-helix transcriptional regulator [Spirosoma pomorum]